MQRPGPRHWTKRNGVQSYSPHARPLGQMTQREREKSRSAVDRAHRPVEQEDFTLETHETSSFNVALR